MDMEENNNAQPVAESTGTQVCKECGRTLPLDDFQRRRNGNVDNVCKACRAEKARIGIARKKAVKVENPALVVTHEEEANAKRVEIAQLSRYLRDFKMAGIALWGMMPGKEEDIDQVIKAEWAIPFCREIFAAAADLRCNCATKVVPALVAKRIYWAEKFIEELGNAFYPLAQECDTSEQKPAEWSVEDEDRIRQIERIAQQAGCTQKLQEEIHDWLQTLRSRPKSSDNWKPSEKQPARVPDISDATLLDELRRRGYKGRVSKCEEVEI